jgi:hypothetical protein
MRTTLDIDADILAAAKDLAKAEGLTMGQMISELARRGLTAQSQPVMAHSEGHGGGFAEPAAAFDHGTWPAFPQRPGPSVTSEMIERIQDELDREDATPFDHGADRPL